MKTDEMIEKTQRDSGRLVNFGILTLVILLVLGTLTLLNTVRANNQLVDLNRSLEVQVANHRHETESTVQELKRDNEQSHDELLRFARCILLVASGDITEAIIDKCIRESERPRSETSQPQSNNSGMTPSSPNNTPTAQPTPNPPKENPDPPEPPRESILPVVDEPVIGCVDGVVSVCL